MNSKQIELALTSSTDSARIRNENSTHDEQNVDILIDLIDRLFEKIPSEVFDRIKAVQICGQMHGVVLWNTADCRKIHSNLVTWQDARCSAEFLSNLPISSKSDLNSGYGCATLFWYGLNGFSFKDYNASGTIHDFITFLLTQKPITMSAQNALSWGYFDLNKLEWQEDLKLASAFPFELLPKVSQAGTFISDSVTILNKTLFNTFIYCSLGDLQCSVYSCLENENDCVINISTSSQVCVSIEKPVYESIKHKLPNSVTIFPYFKNRLLLVAASLNGGNVLANFVQMIQSWNSELFESELKNEESKDKIWTKLISAGEEFSKKNKSNTLICKPTLFGERHAKETYASWFNMKADNTSVGQVFFSICTGLVANLKEMFPAELLRNELNIKRIVGTGTALIKNPIIIKQLELQFQLPIILNKSNDAALGAALFLLKKN